MQVKNGKDQLFDNFLLSALRVLSLFSQPCTSLETEAQEAAMNFFDMMKECHRLCKTGTFGKESARVFFTRRLFIIMKVMLQALERVETKDALKAPVLQTIYFEDITGLQFQIRPECVISAENMPYFHPDNTSKNPWNKWLDNSYGEDPGDVQHAHIRQLVPFAGLTLVQRCRFMYAVIRESYSNVSFIVDDGFLSVLLITSSAQANIVIREETAVSLFSEQIHRHFPETNRSPKCFQQPQARSMRISRVR